MAYNTPELLLVGAARNLILDTHPLKLRSGIEYAWDDFNPEPTYSLTLSEDGWQSPLIHGGDVADSLCIVTLSSPHTSSYDLAP